MIVAEEAAAEAEQAAEMAAEAEETMASVSAQTEVKTVKRNT
jgi:hypothetical protein